MGSCKAMVGHLRVAAGAAGLFRALAAVSCRVVPPQVHCEQPTSSVDWRSLGLRIPRTAEPIEGDEVFAGVSAFGFGGTDYHVVLSSSPEQPRRPLLRARDYLLPEVPEVAGDVAFLFPGQGSQYLGMLAELCRDPEARRRLEVADAVVRAEVGAELGPLLEADVGELTDEQARELEARLRATELAQPAIFVTSAILLDRVRALGIRPHMAIGHSLGEYTALYAAGALGFEEAVRAVTLRGRWMARRPPEGAADPGTMAFLGVGGERARELLGEAGGALVCANLNSYDQTVISGSTADVEACVDLALRRGIRAGLLNVSGAFHCSHCEHVVEPLGEVLRALDFRRTAIPVPSNIRARLYPRVLAAPGAAVPGRSLGPEERAMAIDLLRRNIVEPVHFVRQIELAYEAGIRRFVEVGPRDVLGRLVDEILQGKAFQVESLDGPRGSVLERIAELPSRLEQRVSFRRRPLVPEWPSPAAPPQTPPAEAPRTVADHVRAAVAAVSGLPPSALGDDAEFERELGIDTLKIVEILSRLRGTVLPVGFLRLREATSVRKILGFALPDAHQRLFSRVPSAEPVSSEMLPAEVPGLRCFRYEPYRVEPASREVRGTGDGDPRTARGHDATPGFPRIHRLSGPWTPSTLPEGLGDAVRLGGGSPGRSVDHLVLDELPRDAGQLCRQTIPRVLRLAAELDADAGLPKPFRLTWVTVAPAAAFRPAIFRALCALAKSLEKDLEGARLSYWHVDLPDADPPVADPPEAVSSEGASASEGPCFGEAVWRRILGEPVLGRRLRIDGSLEEGRLRPFELPPVPTAEALGRSLGPGEVVLVTGGARGIAARIVRSLLPRSRCRFLLLGRQPRIEPWIGEEEPGRVEYLAADLLDPGAVRRLELGRRPITLLIHAAGVERSRKLQQLVPEEVEQVLATKVLGLERLLAQLDRSRLRGVVAFSSVAAAFGGFGQPDYAAANGFLDGFADGGLPVLSLAWTAWSEVGMAAREGVRSFLEALGVEALAPAVAVDAFERLFHDWWRDPAPGTTHLVVRGALPESAFLPADPTLADLTSARANGRQPPVGGESLAEKAPVRPSPVHRSPARRSPGWAAPGGGSGDVCGKGLEGLEIRHPAAAAVAPRRIRPPVDGIEVFVADLAAAEAWTSTHEGTTLRAEELREIEALGSPKRRREKRAGKLLAKLLAAAWLRRRTGEEPRLFEIGILAPERPVRARVPGRPDLDRALRNLGFSISHSDDRICVALGAGALGVDLERLRSLGPEVEAEIFDSELRFRRDDFLARLGPDGELSRFYEQALPLVVFTQKEAVLKAAGDGLGSGLSTVRLEQLGIGAPVEASCGGRSYRVATVLDGEHVLSVALVEGREVEAPPERPKAVPSPGPEGHRGVPAGPVEAR